MSVSSPAAPTGLDGARRDVERTGRRAVAAPADVADPDQVEDAAARIERALGPIDVWVNNAMVSVFSPVRELTADEVARVTSVTYLGVCINHWPAIAARTAGSGAAAGAPGPLARITRHRDAASLALAGTVLAWGAGTWRRAGSRKGP